MDIVLSNSYKLLNDMDLNYRHIYWRLQSKYYKIWGYLLKWLPVNRKKIVFNNFRGHGYGDSPKYIAEENMAKYINTQKKLLILSALLLISLCIIGTIISSFPENIWKSLFNNFETLAA